MLFCWRLRSEIWNIYWLLQELKFITDNWKFIEILASHVAGHSAVDDSSDNCVYCTFWAAWVDLLLLKSKCVYNAMHVSWISYSQLPDTAFKGFTPDHFVFWAFSNHASTTECLNTKWRNDEKALQEKNQCAYIGVPKWLSPPQRLPMGPRALPFFSLTRPKASSNNSTKEMNVYLYTAHIT